MRVWEDNDVPYGFLITFRTYGTWLHGDERGSIDRFMNTHNGPRIPPRPFRENYNKTLMKQEPVLLDRPRRVIVAASIGEVCDHRKWTLHVLNVRTNHAHVVVATSDRQPERCTNAFKAYSTRRMREAGIWTAERSPWSDKASQRWLWNHDSLLEACDYVINRQGPDLDSMERWQNPPANAGGSPLS